MHRCRSVFAISEQFFEVFDPLRRKGDGGYVTEAQDGEAAVFRLHVHGNVVEQLLGFTEQLGYAGW